MERISRRRVLPWGLRVFFFCMDGKFLGGFWDYLQNFIPEISGIKILMSNLF